MPTQHEPAMLQHNKERIAGVDAAADDADTMTTMIKIMMIKVTVNDDGDNDDDVEFNQAELKNMQGHLMKET